MQVEFAHVLTMVLCNMVQTASIDTVSAKLGRGGVETSKGVTLRAALLRDSSSHE